MARGNRQTVYKNPQQQLDCWNSYLRLYETPRRESLISWGGYWRRAEAMQEPIWSETSSGLSKAEKEIVHEAIRKLSAREQQVVELIYWHDLSLSKVAARLEITKSSAQTLKKRALEKLRKILSYDPRIVRPLKSRDTFLNHPKTAETKVG